MLLRLVPLVLGHLSVCKQGKTNFFYISKSFNEGFWLIFLFFFFFRGKILSSLHVLRTVAYFHKFEWLSDVTQWLAS